MGVGVLVAAGVALLGSVIALRVPTVAGQNGGRVAGRDVELDLEVVGA